MDDEHALCCVDDVLFDEGTLVYSPPEPHKCTLPDPTGFQDGAVFRSRCCNTLYGREISSWHRLPAYRIRRMVKDGKLPSTDLPKRDIPWLIILPGIAAILITVATAIWTTVIG